MFSSSSFCSSNDPSTISNSTSLYKYSASPPSAWPTYTYPSTPISPSTKTPPSLLASHYDPAPSTLSSSKHSPVFHVCSINSFWMCLSTLLISSVFILICLWSICPMPDCSFFYYFKATMPHVVTFNVTFFLEFLLTFCGFRSKCLFSWLFPISPWSVSLLSDKIICSNSPLLFFAIFISFCMHFVATKVGLIDSQVYHLSDWPVLVYSKLLFIANHRAASTTIWAFALVYGFISKDLFGLRLWELWRRLTKRDFPASICAFFDLR